MLHCRIFMFRLNTQDAFYVISQQYLILSLINYVKRFKLFMDIALYDNYTLLLLDIIYFLTSCLQLHKTEYFVIYCCNICGDFLYSFIIQNIFFSDTVFN